MAETEGSVNIDTALDQLSDPFSAKPISGERPANVFRSRRGTPVVEATVTPEIDLDRGLDAFPFRAQEAPPTRNIFLELPLPEAPKAPTVRPRRSRKPKAEVSPPVREAIPPLSERRQADPELEAHFERITVLKFSLMRSLLELAGNDPDLQASIKPFLGRRKELLERTVKDGELHRQFAPIFAALLNNPRSEELLNYVVDKSAEDISTFIIAEAQAGNNYVPEIGIGAGVYGQIIAAEHMAVKGREGLILFDDAPRMGGTFAEPGSDLWFLNSRTRPDKELPDDPEDIDLTEVSQAGTIRNINPLGRAIIQLADIDTLAYAPQGKLGKAIKTNLLFSCPTALGASLEKATEVIDDPTAPGRYKYTFRNKRDGSTFYMFSDALHCVTGIGRDKIRILDANDPTSQKVIAEEQEKFDNGEFPVVQNFTQFDQIISDPTENFPVEAFCQEEGIAIVGAGDGAFVTLGKLLGYETENAQSVINLDWLKKVAWFGVPASTKEEFIKMVRARYARVGLELPREDEAYFYRAQPFQEKVARIERDGQKVRLIYREEDTGRERAVTVGVAIFTTGFEDATNEVFGGLPIADQDEIRSLITEAFEPQVPTPTATNAPRQRNRRSQRGNLFETPIVRRRTPTVSATATEAAPERAVGTIPGYEKLTEILAPGTTIYYNQDGKNLTGADKFTIVGYGTEEVVTGRTTGEEGSRLNIFGRAYTFILQRTIRGVTEEPFTTRVTPGNINTLRSNLINPELISRLAIPDRAPARVPIREEGYPYALGVEFKGHAIDFTGPVANLPLEEGEFIPSLQGKVGENAVSVTRYAKKAKRLGARAARQEYTPKDPSRVLSVEEAYQEPRTTLESFAAEGVDPDDFRGRTVVNVSASEDELKRKLAVRADSADYLKLLMGEQFLQYKMPDDFPSKLTFDVQRSDLGQGLVTFRVDIQPALPPTSSYSGFADGIVDSEQLQKVFYRATEQGRQLHIEVPTYNQVVGKTGVDTRAEEETTLTDGRVVKVKVGEDTRDNVTEKRVDVAGISSSALRVRT